MCVHWKKIQPKNKTTPPLKNEKIIVTFEAWKESYEKVSSHYKD